jgi:hypothetical protein
VRTRDHAATRCNVDSMHGTVLVLVLVLTLMLTCSHTLKPSLRRHALCASIMSAHASSPFRVTHSSRGARVSGHAQQMRQVGFFSSWGSPASTGELEDMSWQVERKGSAKGETSQVNSSTRCAITVRMTIHPTTKGASHAARCSSPQAARSPQVA